jgi:hypothetical protein
MIPSVGLSSSLLRMASLIFLLLAIALGYLSWAPITSLSGSQSPSVGPKVFVIGLSKTGTTSIGDALAQLGYRRSGWEDIRSRWLYHAYTHGHVEALKRHVDKFDAFEDIPWCIAYRDLADEFPSARFILSLRKNEHDWLRSIQAHTRRRAWEGHADIYGGLRADDCPDAYLETYKRHTEDALEFFSARGEEHRLLTFFIDEPREVGKNATQGDTRWEKLMAFLNIEDVDVPRLGQFPRVNAKSSFGNRDPIGLFWLVDSCFYHIENTMARAMSAVSVALLRE